jgi:ribonuclease VapC
VVIDTSAVIAILRAEPERDRVLAAMRKASHRRISVINYVECGIVVDSRGNVGASRRLDLLLESEDVTLEPVPIHQARLARQAHRDFGWGSGHPARLNFGDCFAYALAADLDEPFLFKGDNFTHTDVRRVAW